ncbi:MAG: hypothetical protein IJ258_03840 [Methanobrevibacter sp.]|uniref:hypothetical protein n=1 Tax=Methanobrevibacter sp. TaxID=66852 RepID=UPI0025F67471|nr:hypothetical protein [Methanobrevibacter sp.]MBQ8017218.1 hypothetical protein [Methanobrevibacter sp.]
MYGEDLVLISSFHRFMGHSRNSVKAYNSAFNKYRSFHNMSLTSLLAEAIKEQDDHVPQNRLKLYDRLMGFRQFLIDNHTGKTISSNLSKIKTFYKYNHVKLPVIPPINTKNIRKNPCISYDDLLTKSEIKKALKVADDNVGMWIYVMLSSGSSRSESKGLTNKTFYEGTFEYHKKDSFRDALRFLSKKDNVVCTCSLIRKKTGRPFYTFLGPEAVQFISKVKLKNKDFNLDNSLLEGSLDYVGRKFRFINDYLDLGYAGGYRRFRPHMLRKFNATYLNHEGVKSDLLDMESVDTLHGRGKDSTRESYFKDNPNVLKLSYIKCMSNVSLYHKYSWEIVGGEVIVYSQKL